MRKKQIFLPHHQLALVAVAAAAVACNDSTLAPLQLGLNAPPPDTVTFTITGYKPTTPSRKLKDVFVSNFSVKAVNGQLEWSTSRDGLRDDFKANHTLDYGFLPNVPESNGDGQVNPPSHFADLLIWLAGIPLVDQITLFCATNLQSSTTNDAFVYKDTRLPGQPLTFLGLRDCEKMYMGLDVTRWDYDGDGIPDYLEMRCGLNPHNPNDAVLSAGGDKLSNMDKCKQHIPVDESSTIQPNQVYAYKYDIETSPSNGTGTFTVSNIPILNGGQDNFIAFYVTESDLATSQVYLYTAYTILKSGAAGNTFKFAYWVPAPPGGTAQNQEVVF